MEQYGKLLITTVSKELVISKLQGNICPFFMQIVGVFKKRFALISSHSPSGTNKCFKFFCSITLTYMYSMIGSAGHRKFFFKSAVRKSATKFQCS